MAVTEFDKAVQAQILRLQARMKAQDDDIQPLIDMIRVDVNPTYFDVLVQIREASGAANALVQGVANTVVGLAIGEHNATRYVTLAEPLLSTIDPIGLNVSALDRPTALKRLDNFNHDLGLLIETVSLTAKLLGAGTGTVAVVGPLRLPNSSDTASADVFRAYLDSQLAAAKALASDDILPDEKFLDNLTQAWESAVGGSFPNDTRPREQQVADSCVFQDRLDDVIGVLDEVVGDRDLLNPAIL